MHYSSFRGHPMFNHFARNRQHALQNLNELQYNALAHPKWIDTPIMTSGATAPEKPQVKTGGSAEKAKPSKRSGLQQKSKIVPPKDKQGTKRSSETGGEKKKTKFRERVWLRQRKPRKRVKYRKSRKRNLKGMKKNSLLVFLEFGWDQCDCLIKNMERPRGRENRVIYYDDLVADLVEKILDYKILKEDLLRTKTSKSENVIADNMHDNMQPTQPEEFDKVATGGAYYLDEGQDETIEDAPSLKRIYLPPSE
ncbi:hypothetical protein RB195_021017 [Necator americanus]|uniref:Uncharacterized protein n=1 Tax=Necator americanus TaxID=51031 RepID=A0ABR1CML0_NECAM